MNIGDYVEATDDIREPLGDHLVNQGRRGHVVRVAAHGGPYPYEVLWENSRLTTFVNSFDVVVVEAAPVADQG